LTGGRRSPVSTAADAAEAMIQSSNMAACTGSTPMMRPDRGAAAIGLVLLGSLVWDTNESLTAAALILLALTGPWAAIVGIDYIRRRGRYDLEALQVFNRRETGGAYWYGAAGWN
jgi:hypothetical protein